MPLPIGGPLVVRLVYLGVASWCTGQESERGAGYRICYELSFRREAAAYLGLQEGWQQEQKTKR